MLHLISVSYFFLSSFCNVCFFFFQAEDGIRDIWRDWSSDVCSSDLGISVTGDVLGRDPVGIDVVLAGDVCYDREMTERVLPFLDRARALGCEVYVGDPGRPYLPHDRLEAVAGYEIAETEGPGLRRTTVWRLP